VKIPNVSSAIILGTPHKKTNKTKTSHINRDKIQNGRQSNSSPKRLAGTRERIKREGIRGRALRDEIEGGGGVTWHKSRIVGEGSVPRAKGPGTAYNNYRNYGEMGEEKDAVAWRGKRSESSPPTKRVPCKKTGEKKKKSLVDRKKEKQK